jgi:glycosyltransferase involved in cell wall biosynthesis
MPSLTLAEEPTNISDQTMYDPSPADSLFNLEQILGHQLDQPSDRSNEIFKVSRDANTYEVTVESNKTLEDYQKISRSRDWSLLLQYVEQMKSKSVVFINPTMEGGGVAMLRPPLVHLLNLLGVEAHWFVMEADAEVFKVTKKIHNILQDRLLPEERLTEEDKSKHWKWNQKNADVLGQQPEIINANILFIDDPQPAPLINLLKSSFLEMPKIIWRDHIHTDHELMSDPTSPQGEIAQYLLDTCGVRQADAVIGHPRLEFMLPGMEDKTAFAPATTDPFDDLNRELSATEIERGIAFINEEIDKKNALLKSEQHYEDVISNIDIARRRIVLVARFDESKGMDHAMKLGSMVRKRMTAQGYSGNDLPQVILIGNGSIDDPSGIPMYQKMLKLRREQYTDEKEDFIVMRLRHNYGAMNSLMCPSDAPMVGIQLSEKEGCETRISDEIEHGIPVVAFNNGGMPLQILEGRSGYILDYGLADHDLERGADIISRLMMNAEEYDHLQKTTKEAGETFNRVNFGTISNITRILRTMTIIHKAGSIDKLWLMDDLVA